MDQITITITAQNDSILKVRWTFNRLSYASYNIDFGLIKALSDTAKSKLAALVSRCMDEEQGGASQAGVELKELAEAGRSLYSALFLDAGDSEQDVGALQQDFKSRADKIIMVSVDNRIYVPWGLIYDGPQPGVADASNVSFNSYSDFWCIKHQLSAVYRRTTEDRVRRPMPLSQFRVLPILNRAAFENARDNLSCEAERDWLNRVVAKFQPAFSASEFDEQWTSNAKDIGLLYFYCHASGTQLALGSNDRLDAYQLRLRFAEAKIGKRDWSCLLFLNGCSTATGNPNGAFLETVGEEGIGGFIGTETEIPDVFALRFSLEFLSLFLSGRSVQDVMDGMRRRHFPLSLLYSVYTYPFVQVETGIEELLLVSPDECNFSFERLGTGRM